jgi:hypothetical protein
MRHVRMAWQWQGAGRWGGEPRGKKANRGGRPPPPPTPHAPCGMRDDAGRGPRSERLPPVEGRELRAAGPLLLLLLLLLLRCCACACSYSAMCYKL